MAPTVGLGPDLTALGVAGLVLAAGKGTRMRSSLPKVLHPVAGRPMLSWTLKTLNSIGCEEVCLVLSEDREGFAAFLAEQPDLRVAVQKNRLGTGDAVAAAAWSFAGVRPAPYAAGYAARGEPIKCRYVLILAGDVPGVQASSLAAFVRAMDAAKAGLGVLGMRVSQPQGYGRMVTRGSELLAIVEEKDADAATRALTLCNTGIMLARTDVLFEALQSLQPNNTQKEFYLTDCVHHARAAGHSVVAHEAPDAQEFAGINDRAQLAAVEAWLVGLKRQSLMLSGVTIVGASTVYVEEDVTVGEDTVIESGCHLAGRTRIGRGCLIGAGSVLKNAVVADGERIPALSVRLS